MLAHSSVLGALRTATHPTCRPPLSSFSCLVFRPLSTRAFRTRSTLTPFHPLHPSPTLPTAVRSLSLGSIFRAHGPVPQPDVVSRISWLEAEANVNPHDVQKQLALYQALLETKLPSSYELIISRWERMCEFDPSSSLLHSSDAFKIYLTALANTGQQASINSAVRRRDSLLASHPLPSQSPLPSDSAVDPAVSSEADSTPATTSTENPSAPTGTTDSQQLAQSVLANTPASSSSQNLAQSVLAGHPSPSPALNYSRPDNHDGPIQVSIVESKGSWIPRLARFVITVLVISVFGMVLISILFENTGVMRAGPSQSQFEPTQGKVYKFSDVHGVDEAKEELQDIVAFLKDPASFATLGGKLPKGVLLTGPPGTGKTLLARAVAGEAGVPFFFASGSDFEEMFVGVGAKRVRELFAAARKKEPAIIFIDELDAVGGKRSSRDQNYMKQTLNQLLTEMDGFTQDEGVIIIAATNFPQSLDSALVRPGRFDRVIAVPLPDIRGRMAILQRHLKDVIVDKGVDTKSLARGTPGFSGADLRNMVNLAAVQAAKQKASGVSTQHLEWAKDRILMGAERRSMFIDDKVKLATAYHEGGHTLVALYTPGATPLHKVTIMPRGHALGVTHFLPEDDRHSVSYKQYLASIDVSLGGRIAEELIYGSENVTSGASSDIQKASRTARYMVKNWGFSQLGPIDYSDAKEYSGSNRGEKIEEEVSKIITDSEARAKAVLKGHEHELHRLAHALVEHETLDAEQVAKVIKGEPIKDISAVLEEQISEVKDEGKGEIPNQTKALS